MVNMNSISHVPFSRTNMKEPTKSLLFHDMKSLFLPEHILEFSKFSYAEHV